MKITCEVEKFLSQNVNNGALLITGKWGCGKTYFLRQIAKNYNSKEQYLFVIISLFGVDTIENLHRTVKESIVFSRGFSEKADVAKKWFGKINKVVSPIASTLSDSSNIAKGFDAVLNINWSDFISVEKNIDCFIDGKETKKRLVLVFDDFERSKIDMVDLMGAINDYSESKDIKVIIVANEDRIVDDSYNDIKEKLILRTLHMSIDNTNIVNNIISSYKETSEGYQTFLQKHSAIIHQVFIESQTENIRSLISFLIDFERIYDTWKNTDIPINENIANILYQFGAAEFEYKAGNYVKTPYGYILNNDVETDKSENTEIIKNKYFPDTFTGLLTSLAAWIVDGEWNEDHFIDEIKKRYMKKDVSPEQIFIYYNFWELQQSDIDNGMPVALEEAYNGELSCDELIYLIQKIHIMKKNEIPLPCEVNYKRIDNAFEKRKKLIKQGKVIEPKRYTFSEKNQLDDEAYELYDKIEHLDAQLHAWENRRVFISYLNFENGVSVHDLKNKYLESFDDELLNLFIKSYNEALNGRKREFCWAINDLFFDDPDFSTNNDIEKTLSNFRKMVSIISMTIISESDGISKAISKSFIKLLNEKIAQISAHLEN